MPRAGPAAAAAAAAPIAAVGILVSGVPAGPTRPLPYVL